MRSTVKFVVAGACLLALLLAAILPSATVAAPPPPRGGRVVKQAIPRDAPVRGAYKPGEILVKLRPTASATTLEQRHALRPAVAVSAAGPRVYTVPAGSEEQTIAALRQDPDVLYAEPNYRYQAAAIPNDPDWARQWNMPLIGMPTAWDVSTGAASVVVAVVDSGVDLGHPEFAGRLQPGYNALAPGLPPQDDLGHGTHVAGIVAAAGNNALGIAGVAWQTTIMPVKVLDSSGGGYASQIADGLRWAADHGALVINMSWGGDAPSRTIAEAVDYAYRKGVVLVAAAGNCGGSNYLDNGCLERNPVFYPAALPNVIAVAATGPDDQPTSYTNHGSYVNLAAPGGDRAAPVWSTLPLSRGGYGSMAGTSMAAPHVSGAAALLLATRPGLSNAEVASLLQASALDLGAAGRDDYYGDGRLNVAAALAGTPVATRHAGGAYAAVAADGAVGFSLPWVADTSEWQSYVAVQNTNPAASAAFLDLGGVTQTLAPGATRLYPVNDLGWPEGATGGLGLFGAGPELVAVALLDGPGHDAAGYAGASIRAAAGQRALHVGSAGRLQTTSIRTQGAGSGEALYLPLLLKRVGSGWLSTIYLSSTSASASSTVVVDFYQTGGSGIWQRSGLIPPGGSLAIAQADMADVPDGTVLSAVVRVTAGPPVAAVVYQTRPDGMALSYEGFASGAPTVYAPLQFREYGGWSTGIQVQNVGSAPCTATLTVIPQGGGLSYTYSASLAPGASHTWDFRNPDQVPGLPAGFLGSATVSSDNGQPLVAVVNEVKSGETISLSYDALTGGATTLYAPFIARDAPLWEQQWSTGLQVQNLGGATAQVLIEYVSGEGTAVYSTTAAIPPGSSVSFDHRQEGVLPLPSGFLGGARLTSTNGVPIGAIVNFVNYR